MKKHKEILEFIYYRLINYHQEREHFEYMLEFKEAIDEIIREEKKDDTKRS